MPVDADTSTLTRLPRTVVAEQQEEEVVDEEVVFERSPPSPQQEREEVEEEAAAIAAAAEGGKAKEDGEKTERSKPGGEHEEEEEEDEEEDEWLALDRADAEEEEAMRLAATRAQDEDTSTMSSEEGSAAQVNSSSPAVYAGDNSCASPPGEYASSELLQPRTQHLPGQEAKQDRHGEEGKVGGPSLNTQLALDMAEADQLEATVVQLASLVDRTASEGGENGSDQSDIRGELQDMKGQLNALRSQLAMLQRQRELVQEAAVREEGVAADAPQQSRAWEQEDWAAQLDERLREEDEATAKPSWDQFMEPETGVPELTHLPAVLSPKKIVRVQLQEDVDPWLGGSSEPWDEATSHDEGAPRPEHEQRALQERQVGGAEDSPWGHVGTAVEHVGGHMGSAVGQVVAFVPVLSETFGGSDASTSPRPGSPGADEQGEAAGQIQGSDGEFQQWVSNRIVDFWSGLHDQIQKPLLTTEQGKVNAPLVAREPYKLERSSAEPSPAAPAKDKAEAVAEMPTEEDDASQAPSDEVEKLNLSAQNVKKDLSDIRQLGPDLRVLLLHLNPELTGSIDLLDRCRKLQVVCLAETMVHGDIEVFAACPVLVEVNLWSCSHLRGDVEVFEHCPYLARCWLGYTGVTGDLRSFSACPKLEKLELFETKVTGSLDGLLSCPELSFLWLRKSEVFGRMEVLAKLKRLATVDLRFTGVVGDPEVLRQALPGCAIKVLSATTIAQYRVKSMHEKHNPESEDDRNIAGRHLSVGSSQTAWDTALAPHPTRSKITPRSRSSPHEGTESIWRGATSHGLPHQPGSSSEDQRAMTQAQAQQQEEHDRAS